MKRLVLTLAILLAFALNGVAQPGSFAPQGAEWYFDVFNPWGMHHEYALFSVDGDTIIQGHHCSIITQNFVETGPGHEYGEFVYQEGNKVYWFNPTTNDFTTLYDFDAEAGDSWYYEVGSCSHLVTVDSVGSVTWDGHTYRTQWVKFNEYQNHPAFRGKIIEGIGYEKGLFPSVWTCNGDILYDASEIEYLRCYVEDGDILYHERDFNCDNNENSFTLDNTRWAIYYQNFNLGWAPYIQIGIKGDTVVDGMTYHKVINCTSYGNVIDGDCFGGMRVEADGKWYFRILNAVNIPNYLYFEMEPNEERLIYDFSLSECDWFPFDGDDYYSGYSQAIFDIDEIEINGSTRKRFWFDYDCSEGEHFYSKNWIEGIGCNYGLLYPIQLLPLDGSEYHLGEVYQDGELIYKDPYFDDHFAPQGAEWYFNLPSFMGSPITYYHMEVLGDTIIQGHQCSVISRQFLGGNGNEQYVYEDNGKVYWYNQTLGRFTTLYDFDAEVGESWTCEIDSCTYEVTVTELTYYEGWGHNHQFRAQRVSYDGELGYYGGGTIIEGIGEISGLFPYPYACSGEIEDGPYPNWLRCYLVNGDPILQLGPYDCEEQSYCWDGTAAESYGGGDGTEENPYLIYTSEQLALLAQQTNNGTGGDAYYKIMEDINLANCDGGIQQWISIGTPEHPFTGHFDGWGDAKTILNMHQTITDGDTQPVGGLFGCTNGAEINNVHLAQCYVSGNGKYVGTLVGYAGLTNISDCSIYDGCAKTDNGVAGGLVGYAGYTYGEQWSSDETYTIARCRVKEAVKVEGSECAGGVAGKVNDIDAYAHYVLSNCQMTGWVESFYVHGGKYAGGIVGSMWYGEMNYSCCNRQKVVADGDEHGGCAGGLAGMLNCVDLSEGINYGQVVSSGSWNVHVGGISGYLGNGNINMFQNYGDVEGTGNCGGIIGFYCFRDDIIVPSFLLFSVQNCHNYAQVSGYRNAGGIVGSVGVGNPFGNLYVVECTNYGDVATSDVYYADAGGIVGKTSSNYTYILNVYNRGSVSASRCPGGIIGGDGSARHCTVQNVYNTGEVITAAETKGAIAYIQQENDHFSDCYWLGVLDNHAGVSQGEPLQHSCAFWPTTYYGEWRLDSLQFGHDLVEALNTGAEALVEQYPAVLTLVHRWEYDSDHNNDGFPVFSGIEMVGYPFVGTEWYYEIQNEDGTITYQHLEYAGDTTVNHKEVVIIIRTNTLYDKGEHQEVTREYLYEQDGVVYWWNDDLQEFTVLYDFGAEPGDEWEIIVGSESVTMHVDSVMYNEYEGEVYKVLKVSDENNIFSGTVVSGIGHMTSFFPERLMTRNKKYRVEGMRCFWRNGELLFKNGDRDCDEVYQEYHNGIEEDGPSTGSGTFTLYPNPTNSVLTIHHSALTTSNASHFNIPNSSFRITNLMGQTVQTGNLNAETQQIDVSDLPQGMYFISIGDLTQKFVVQ